jgi:hypothetical protein
MAINFYLRILNQYFNDYFSPVKKYFFDFILNHYQLYAKIIFKVCFIVYSYYFLNLLKENVFLDLFILHLINSIFQLYAHSDLFDFTFY